MGRRFAHRYGILGIDDEVSLAAGHFAAGCLRGDRRKARRFTRRRASISARSTRATKPGDDFFQYANGMLSRPRGDPGGPAGGVAAARNDRPDGSQSPAVAPGSRERRRRATRRHSRARPAPSTCLHGRRRRSSASASRAHRAGARRDPRGARPRRPRPADGRGARLLSRDRSPYHRQRSQGARPLRHLSQPVRARPARPRLLSEARVRRRRRGLYAPMPRRCCR